MKKTKKKKASKMSDQELIEKYRSQYKNDKNAYQACVDHFGPRPSPKGIETAEQLKSIREAQQAWDFFFENSPENSVN